MTRVLSMGRMKPSPAATLSTQYEAPTLPPPGPERDAWLRESGAKGVLENLDRFPADGTLVTPVP
jgi:hypothetical protein